MSMKDYAETLSEAIDIIVAQRISEIAQDETVICTIVDDSDKENGHYKVAPNDAVIYDAYTDITTYSIDARVYVLTPKDGSPRTIVSRYLGDEASSPIEYVSPAKTIIPQGNPLKIEKLEQGQNIYLDIPPGTKNYNDIYISPEFLAPFNGNLAGSPWYGLVLTGTNTKTKQVRTFIFDSAQMFGDPFNFMGYFKQEQGFVYSLTEDFDELSLSLQIVGMSDIYAAQIAAQNISIQFGIETATAVKDQIELTTTDSLSYDPDHLQKTITLLWYNLDGNKYIGFEDGIFDAEKAQSTQEDDNVYYAIEWYKNNKDGSLELLPETGEAKKEQKITITCDTSKASYNVQAILWRNGTQYKAEIEFSNSMAENITPPEIAGLEIDLIHGEKSLDVYPFYGTDNLLIDPANQYLSRNIQFTWRTATGIVNPEYWADATIYWYLPINATMLKAGYTNKGLTQLQVSDKEGYLCYTAADPATNDLFAYSISNLYNVAFTNNTIICVVKKDSRTWEAKKTLVFSSFGASGTDYTIAFEIADGTPGFINGVHSEQNPLKITAQLYDPEGKKIENENKTWEITGYDLATPLILNATMKAEWLGEEVTLTTYYPVAYLGRQDIYASVPTTIIYDNLGTKANYYSGEMQVFNKLNNSIVAAEWSAFYANINDQKFLPQVKDARLFVPSLYVSGTGAMAVQAKTGNEILWYQPLVIVQNKYASQFLNNWDGSLEVDNDNNYIMAEMIGAGRKNEDNTFSGVLMGDVGEKGGTTGTGLYGYHQGAQSFGFDTDGTAFIGKEGKGRILFDGNESTIKSANWETTQKGTCMDLDNASLQLIGDNGSLKFVNGKLELQLESFNMIMGGSGSDNQTLDKYIDNSATNIADAQIQTSISASNGAIHLAIVDTAGQTLQEANTYAEQQASAVVDTATNKATEAAKSTATQAAKDAVDEQAASIKTDAVSAATSAAEGVAATTAEQVVAGATSELNDKIDVAAGVAAGAQSTANNAASVAAGAQTTANGAVGTANAASAAAGQAQADAKTANETAGQAVATAGQAQNTANEANKTAGEANKTAGEAKTTADQAKSAAEAAENTANAASSAAASAQKEAEEAAKLANDAKEAGVILGQNYAILDATVKGIEAEVSHSASYFGTCSTPQSGENSHIKVIDLPVPNITDFNYDNVFMQNRTIAIQFAYSEQPTNTNTTTYIQTTVTEIAYTKDTYYVKSGDNYILATGDFSATATYYYAVSTLTKVGRELSLKINDKTHKVYINGEVTSVSNPFGWAKGNVVYFTYQGTNSENGQWLVSDSGSYSNVLQTAYDITSSVSSLDGRLSSEIKQTSESITQEVIHRASYYGTCNTAAGAANKTVELIDAPDPFRNGQFFTDGRLIAVKFTNAEEANAVDITNYEEVALTADTYTKDTYYIHENNQYIISSGDFISGTTYYYQIKTQEFQGQTLQLTIKGNTYPIYRDGKITSVLNPFGWPAGSVVYFTYSTSGYWLVSDSGSYSRIMQTADSIASTIASMDGKLSSEIEQTEASITAKITDLNSGLSSQINANAGNIILANQLIGSLDEDVQALASNVDLLSNKSTIYFGQGDYEDDRSEWLIDLTTATTGFKSGDIVQIRFAGDRPTSSSGETIYFQFFYADETGEQQHIGEGDEATKFAVRGDYLNWYEDETLAFIYTGNEFLLTYVSQSQIETTATSIAASVSSVNGYAALIYDYDYIELDPLLSTCTFYAEFNSTPKITTLSAGIIIALKCDEALSLEEWEKCYGDISIQFQQDSVLLGSFRTKDTPHWLEGDEVYFMLTVDTLGDPYLRPTSPISTAQTEMLSDMISARVVNGATGNGFGWNLDAESFTLQASVTDASGTTTQTEVLKCDANGLTVTGTINALNGTIGGWTINEYKITGGESKDECCVMQVPNYVYGYNTDGTAKKTKWVFAAGSESHDAYGDAPFRVDKNGNLYMSAAYVSGGKIYFGSNNNCNLQWKNSRLQVNDANFWAREITANTLTCTEGFKFLGSAVGARTVTIGGTSYTILTI